MGYDKLIVCHAKNDRAYISKAKPLNGLDPVKFTKALRLGYEIEPEFESEDWIRHEIGDGFRTGRIRGITANNKAQIDFVEMEFPYEEYTMFVPIIELVHASTEEVSEEQERQTFAKIGREVGEFREGDAGLGKDGIIYLAKENMESVYQSGNLSGFHPAESFISFEEGD